MANDCDDGGLTAYIFTRDLALAESWAAKLRYGDEAQRIKEQVQEGVRTRVQEELGVTPTAVLGGFEGESYADIPTVVKTVGLVPPETRAARTQEMKEIADFAKLLGCSVVALHLGFIPHASWLSDLGVLDRSSKSGETCLFGRPCQFSSPSRFSP